MSDRLNAGQELTVNDQLLAPNGQVKLVMQTDGNLVLYRTDTNLALWASHTQNKAVNRAIMQGDGNFVCYDSQGIPQWASHTNRHPGSYVVLQNDGNLVVYEGATAVWASNTGGQHWQTPTGKVITPQRKDLGSGHFMVSSAEFHPESGAAHATVQLTSTNKLSGFHGSVGLHFYDGAGNMIDAQHRDFGCAQAPVFGAAHASFSWDLQAPAGTQGFGLSQGWHPHWPLPQLTAAIDQFFGEVGNFFGAGIDAADKWCQVNPDACKYIGFALFVIAGTALCVAFPGDCEIVIEVVATAAP